MPFPQPGGEADKVGNRYESLWTIRCVIDVIRGRSRWIEVESLNRADSEGAEFSLRKDDGTLETHSVKRQRIGGGWTISAMFKRLDNNEAIGSQLINKLLRDQDLRVRFVTADPGSDATPIFDAVRASKTAVEFDRRLDSNQVIKKSFENHILSFFNGQFAECFETLKRFLYSIQGHHDLLEIVDDQIGDYFYRSTGEFDAESVRELLAGFVIDNLGSRLTKGEFLSFLNGQKIFEHDFNRNSRLFERVEEINEQYVSELKSVLINGSLINRDESQQIHEKLEDLECKTVIAVGTPGGGKSGVLVEVAERLRRENVPILTIRLDTLPEAPNSKALGHALGLTEKSPVTILDGMSKGTRSVLLIDQVDAISSASGRKRHAIPVFQQLLKETERHPNMKVLLACRSFDLSHDASLRQIEERDTSQNIEIGPLSRDSLAAELDKVDLSLDLFDSRQILLLSSPFNLFLYLAGNFRVNPIFDGVHELYDRFRVAKEHEFREMGLQGEFWRYLFPLTEALSDSQNLDAPKHIFEDAGISSIDLDKMVSSGILIQGERRIRFFHESFFDYSYAKWFFRNGFTLHRLLTEQTQDLFRRSQVRQILVDLRRNRPDQYQSELETIIAGNVARPLIKAAIFDWLGSLEDPLREEWELLEPLLFDDNVGSVVRKVPWNRVGWFDLMDSTGVFERWFQTNSDRLINYGVFLMSLQKPMQRRSRRIAEIVEPFFREDSSEEWKNRIQSIFRSDEIYHSEESFEMVLKMVEWGWYDEADEYSVPGHNLPKLSPPHALRLYEKMMARRLAIFPVDPLNGVPSENEDS